MALVCLAAASCFDVRGCGDAGRRPIIDVQIVNPTTKPNAIGPKISDDDLKPTILKLMARWPDFAFRRNFTDEVGWQLTVRLAQLTDRAADGAEADARARSAGFVLELRALGDVEGERREYTAELLLTRTEPASVPIAELVQDALLEAGARLMRFREIQRAEPAEVVAAIDDAEEAVRLVAIQTAGERSLREAIPALIERLRDEDEAGAIIVSAVGALSAMNATEATDAIIDTARRQGRSYLIPLLYALAELGGRQAEAYLFTVQSGHPDPAVKNAAAEALAELERRAQDRERETP